MRRKEGKYEMNLKGKWKKKKMWEIKEMEIIKEIRQREEMKNMGKLQIDVIYEREKEKMWRKVERMRKMNDLKIYELGKRRRN